MTPTVESVLASYGAKSFAEVVNPIIKNRQDHDWRVKLEFLVLGRAEYMMFVEFATMNKHVYTGHGGLREYNGLEVLRSNAVSKIKVA